MERLMDKPWHICASNAVTGEGLNEVREIDVKSDYYDYYGNYEYHQFVYYMRTDVSKILYLGDCMY